MNVLKVVHINKELTTIPITKGTRDRLKAIGRKGETYDALILRIIEALEKKENISC